MNANINTLFRDLLDTSGAMFTTINGTHFFNLHGEQFQQSMPPARWQSEWQVHAETKASLETFNQICDYLKDRRVDTDVRLDYEPEGYFIVSKIETAEGISDVEHHSTPRQLSFNLFWKSSDGVTPPAPSSMQTADDGSDSDQSQDDESCATKDGSMLSATQYMGTLSLGANTNPSEQ